MINATYKASNWFFSKVCGIDMSHAPATHNEAIIALEEREYQEVQLHNARCKANHDHLEWRRKGGRYGNDAPVNHVLMNL